MSINNILVSGYPKPADFLPGAIYEDYKVVINVSDEFSIKHHDALLNLNIRSFYFPMGELIPDMGLNSLFGALNVLYLYRNEKILLHCHAGRNRSPTVYAAYYFMLNNTHLPGNNKLLKNSSNNHLPPLYKMEVFLKNCKAVFDQTFVFAGGAYDWVIEESLL